jgi:predicted Zn finger-like uncharacterized protein
MRSVSELGNRARRLELGESFFYNPPIGELLGSLVSLRIPNFAFRISSRCPMNNMCPSCGAIYNVAAKDIGRRIKCKKCGTALEVRETGLAIEDANAPLLVPPRPDLDPDDDFEEEPPRRKRDRDRRSSGLGFNPVALFAKIGGISTILFGFGAFLVIVFLFMPIIGTAGVERVAAAKEKLEQERDSKIKRLIPKGKRLEELTSDEQKKYSEDAEKIRKDYEKQIGEAEDDARYERISNKRSRWIEMYGMMFGFLFLMVGCIGYMVPEQSLMRRILGTVVLGVQMIIIFIIFSTMSGCGGRGPAIPG